MGTPLKKLVGTAIAAVALAVALPATPAFAINTLACSGRTDLVKVSYSHGGGLNSDVCFANAGTMAVNIGGAFQAYTGVNKVTINFERDGRYVTTTAERQVLINFTGGNVRVYEVRIW